MGKSGDTDMLDLRSYQSGRLTQTVALSATIGMMTLVRLPKWVGSVIIRARTDAVSYVEGDQATDATPIGARAYKTISADDDRQFVFRTNASRSDYVNWPPMFALAPTTTSGTIVEIELERW